MTSNKRKAKDETIEKLIVDYGNAMFECGEYDFSDTEIQINEKIDPYFKTLQERVYLAKCNLLDAINQ